LAAREYMRGYSEYGEAGDTGREEETGNDPAGMGS
jgi:hypothetical protein